ncbi:hypothetical protein ACWDYJ_23740 [Streptomyces sp. NPDC003042]
MLTGDGVAYAGVRRPGLTGFTWYDLTDEGQGFPENPCSISVASSDNVVSIQVQTTEDELYETICVVTIAPGGGPVSLTCDENWTQLDTPTPGDPGNNAAQQPLSTGDTNQRPKDKK